MTHDVSGVNHDESARVTYEHHFGSSYDDARERKNKQTSCEWPFGDPDHFCTCGFSVDRPCKLAKDHAEYDMITPAGTRSTGAHDRVGFASGAAFHDDDLTMGESKRGYITTRRRPIPRKPSTNSNKGRPDTFLF